MSNYDEDASIVNDLLDLEILIVRPVAQVWKQWLDLSSWVISHDIEQVEGERDEVGGITRVSDRCSKEVGYPTPHYHYCKVIELIPQRRYVLKSYTEKGGSYGLQFIGFDEARFHIVDRDSTKVHFRFLGETRGMATLIVEHPAKLTEVGSDNHMWRNLENLKRIVESQPRTAE